MRVQEPITTDVPLGLDEPAPILVWRSGLIMVQPPLAYRKRYSAYTSEKAAMTAKRESLRDFPYHFKEGSPPFRVPLKEALREASFHDCLSLVARDESLRIIEEYPL